MRKSGGRCENWCEERWRKVCWDVGESGKTWGKRCGGK